MSAGEAFCWGDNVYGTIGDGTNTNSSTPVNVFGISNVEQVAAGVFHSCARLTSGDLKCWGRNHTGQLGDGTNIDRDTPVNVIGF